MTAINFTKTALESLPTTGVDYQISDIRTQGLILRVNPGGRKSYMLYRRIGNKMTRIGIGRFADISLEEARRQATFLNAQIMNGIRPNEVLKEKKAEPTLNCLFNRYYHEHLKPHTKRPEDNKALYERDLKPLLGRLRLSEITRKMMKKIHLDIAGTKTGKAQANRILTIASAIFNFGIKEEIFNGRNPCFGIKKFRVKSRDRFLSREELVKFFDALSWEDELFQDFFLLSLYVGARKTTMLMMRWEHVDLDLARWRIPEDETKNRDVNIYVLSEPSLEILTRRKNTNQLCSNPSKYVFPGEGSVGHLVDPKRAWARIKRRMAISDIRIHDLRRTLASYMAINGSSLPVIGMALNHKSRASTEIYARLSQDPIKDALNAAVGVMKKDLNIVSKKRKNLYNVLLPQSLKYCVIGLSI